jgi:hypothetical protein
MKPYTLRAAPSSHSDSVLRVEVTPNPTPDDLRALALLIAAAPDLLAFVQDIADRYADKCSPTCDCASCTWHDEAAALVTKAEGR